MSPPAGPVYFRVFGYPQSGRWRVVGRPVTVPAVLLKFVPVPTTASGATPFSTQSTMGASMSNRVGGGVAAAVAHVRDEVELLRRDPLGPAPRPTNGLRARAGPSWLTGSPSRAMVSAQLGDRGARR